LVNLGRDGAVIESISSIFRRYIWEEYKRN